MKRLLTTSLFALLFLVTQAQSSLTLSVDMSQYAGSFTTVGVSGSFNDWSGDANPMTDMGNGIWTTTLDLADGTYEYKFQLDAWTSGEEDFPGGESCTLTTGEFTNRLVVVNGDATLDVNCFSSCSACMDFVEGMITVQVDMNQYEGDFTTVGISGAFNEWSGDANPLLDDDGDGVWTGTVLMPAGPNEYKFQLDAWASGEEDFPGGESCTLTTGEFTNRLVVVNGDATLDVNCFNSCATCPSGDNCLLIEDFENLGADTLSLQYFGSTLDGAKTSIVANPDATGINESSTVTQFIKAANSEVWAGGFGALTTPVSVPTGEQVCIKVYLPAVGNLALKLEGSSTGGDNWIQQLPVETANEWVELCFDTNLPSIEDPMNPAAGHSYTTLVLFFDFGSNFEQDMTYYFDDLKVCSEGEAAPVDVTFQVNMSEYDGAFTGVLLRGSFNNWDESTPMNDMGNGNYAVTLSLAVGAQEYKFFAQGTDEWEEFTAYEECVTTGEFINRISVITEITTLDNVCYNSCYACGESSTIEINIGTSEIDVALDGIFLAGGAEFGAPGRYNMTDPDGDGVYSIRFSRPTGFTSFYTFTNGACADFSCKENITDQDCANPDNFNDRFMEANGDLSINTCFGECTTTTECIGNGLADGNITFTVNMSEYTGTFTTVYLSGTLNEWSADSNPMTDMGNGIWSTTILVPGGNYEYKFQLDNFVEQEMFAGGEDCTITDDTGMFVNRALVVDGDADLDEVCYNACTACMVNTNNLTIDNQMFNVIPSLVKNNAFIQFNASATTVDKVLNVYNAIGKLMMTQELENFQSEYNLNTSNFANGVYFINVRTENRLGTQRIVVTK